jgi:hypothetical protein
VGTMSTALAMYVAAVGSNPMTDMLCDTVDLIEINHCYDDKGQLVFDQLLFYDWCPVKARYDVRDWRLLRSPMQIPKRDPETGMSVVIWRDGHVLRRIHTTTVRESWTQYDPEITEQQHLSKDQRRSFVKLSARRRVVAPLADRGGVPAPHLAAPPEPDMAPLR